MSLKSEINISKLAIITGEAGNMGQALVKKFIKQGHDLVGMVVAGECIPTNHRIEYFEKKTVEILSETEADKFVKEKTAANKKIDTAVLTVGGFAMGKIADTSAADILKQYKLNYETAYHAAGPVFLQIMKQGTGSIFLVGLRPGLSAGEGKGMTGYSLIKSLIFRLADLMNE